MFVAGCHRSGTSYVSGLLSRIFEVTRNSDIDRTVDNPGGYFESTLLGPFNDQLLALIGASWDCPPLAPPFWRQGKLLQFLTHHKSEFESYALQHVWVDKDPRLSITFPAYQHLLLRRVPCVIALRHPFEVAASLYLRDGFSPAKGLLIWYLYNRHCSTFVDASCDHLVSYEALISVDPACLKGLTGFLAPHLECMGAAPLDVAILADHCLQASRPALKRNSVDHLPFDVLDASCKSIADLCLSHYSQLRASCFSLEAYRQIFAPVPDFLINSYAVILAEGEPSLEYRHSHEISLRSSACSSLSELGLSADLQTGDPGVDQWLIQSYSELVCSLHEFKQALASPSGQPPCASSSPDEEQGELRSALAATMADLAALQGSTFWRLSGPLRRLVDAGKRLRRRFFNSPLAR